MRQYECECLSCNSRRQYAFKTEPYPEIGETFTRLCKVCNRDTNHTRVLTRKAIAEMRRMQQENDLRNTIVNRCSEYGFNCRFLYQSVIITTPLADWCFDYHEPRITLYHESTFKINFKTGNYAKAHEQFRDRKMSPIEVVDYIAKHDQWRAKQRKETEP